jgi:hypothetical protein
LYGDYAHRKSSHGNVVNFIERELKWFQNPSMDRILWLSERFSPEWRAELKTVQDESQAGINSIVSNRNNIAHGEDVALTYGALRKYYEVALAVLEKIEEQCSR